MQLTIDILKSEREKIVDKLRNKKKNSRIMIDNEVDNRNF